MLMESSLLVQIKLHEKLEKIYKPRRASSNRTTVVNQIQKDKGDEAMK